jgi:hypothetical protein
LITALSWIKFSLINHLNIFNDLLPRLMTVGIFDYFLLF